jgi:hypothetical protein
VTTLQVQTSQLGADRVTAIPETTRDLRGALSYGPEFFEQCYVFRIPTHGRYYTPTIKYWLVVRFTPTSGHRQLDCSGPKSAKTGSQAYVEMRREAVLHPQDARDAELSAEFVELMRKIAA